MKKKIFNTALVLSALPYYALFIVPVVAAIRVFSQYNFFSTFPIYFLAMLCVLGAHFPVIPLSVGFHTGIIVSLILKKLNVPKKTAEILSVISAVIIFSLFTAVLFIFFSEVEFV